MPNKHEIEEAIEKRSRADAWADAKKKLPYVILTEIVDFGWFVVKTYIVLRLFGLVN